MLLNEINDLGIGSVVQDTRRGLTGKVVGFTKHDPENPIEDHGFIEVEIINPGKTKMGKGELEHYVFYQWEKHLKILS